MTNSLQEMDERTRGAALRTVYDSTIQNPRATELRGQAIELLNENVQGLSPDELAHRLEAIRSIREAASAGDSTSVARSVAEDTAPDSLTESSTAALFGQSPFFDAPAAVRPTPVDRESDPRRMDVQPLRDAVTAAISLDRKGKSLDRKGKSPFWRTTK